jgi:RimJ/RimL family protein N-acetyltransferase
MKATLLTPEEIEFVSNINNPLTTIDVYTFFPWQRFGIRLDDGTLVGSVFLFNINLPCRKAEIGIHIFDRRGISPGGLMAFQECLRESFEKIGLNRVYGRIYPENKTCISCAEKLGFVYEGMERQALFINGKYQDLMIYSLLKSEFESGDSNKFNLANRRRPTTN